jgi:hypothetical protein
MKILIDLENMCVRYKHVNPTHLMNIAHIELAHVPTAVLGYTMDELECLTDLELKKLYESMCGQKYTGYARNILIQNVHNLCELLPDSNLNGVALQYQADFIAMDDDRFYSYQQASKFPKSQQELYLAKPLTASASYCAVLTTNHAAKTAPAPAQLTPAPENVRVNTRRENIVACEPKIGSKTGRVWEICKIAAEGSGKPYNFKALRTAIISSCEAEGINASTASVQFGKWKNSII